MASFSLMRSAVRAAVQSASATISGRVTSDSYPGWGHADRTGLEIAATATCPACRAAFPRRPQSCSRSALENDRQPAIRGGPGVDMGPPFVGPYALATWTWARAGFTVRPCRWT